MTPIPSVLAESIDRGDRRLGRALELLEWPNAGTDAPCHEVNAILNISYHLQSAPEPFVTYAEGTMANRGRVDLIGVNAELAMALEAKGWGRIHTQAQRALADWERLADFRPQLSEVAGDGAAIDWWLRAPQRWRVLVISSFRGDAVKDAWLSADEATARSCMDAYAPAERCREVNGGAVGFLALWRAIAPPWRRASHINDGSRWGAGNGWVLWAAEPLP
jgi:hypothetical protein